MIFKKIKKTIREQVVKVKGKRYINEYNRPIT